MIILIFICAFGASSCTDKDADTAIAIQTKSSIDCSVVGGRVSNAIANIEWPTALLGHQRNYVVRCGKRA